jgi:lysophospholipase L1-like esterase
MDAAGASMMADATSGSVDADATNGSADADARGDAGGGGGAADGAMSGSGVPAGDGGAVPAVVSGGVRWIGRVDLSNPATPKFAWSGSGFVATAAGSTLSVSLRSDGATDPIYFQPVIDGTPGTRLSVAASEGLKRLVLGSGLTAGDHVVELYRETEGKAGFASSTFLGFVDGTLKDPPPYGGRLVEIVGDSISAGYGDLGVEQHPNFGPDPTGGCTFSTLTESAYLTYGVVAARALGADASVVAASGWGIYSDNLGNVSNGLPRVYSNTVGGQSLPAWNFAVEPQAVIINLGTNDFSANMTLGSDAFTTAYRAFLTTVRSKYAHAWIYCAIGPLLFGTGLTNATAYINAMVGAVNASGDTKVKVLDFGQQNSSLGTGCSYHPNVTEHQRMAAVLANELRTRLGW